jgi:hypothetical protein
VAESIDISWKRIAELRELEIAQTLYPQGFQESDSVKVENGTKPIKWCSIEDAPKYWMLAATRGNVKATALVAACVAEALERRLDAAFGVVRTEQERNDRMEARVDHADGWRKNFTDWQQLDGCRSGIDYAKRVNELKAHGGLPVGVGIKDYDSRQIKKMTNCEVIYDAMRRNGKDHHGALKAL